MSRQRKPGATTTTRRKSAASNPHPLVERAPTAKRLTPYDEAHLVTYLRLLDANANGETAETMVHVVFDENPDMSPDAARRAAANHLKRAIWISEEGYRHFLRKLR
jgi:hypothetical protein